MLGLTGTPDQVGRVAKAYRVYFAAVDRTEEDDDYLGAYRARNESAVDHSIVMYLINPRGEFVDFYTQREEAPEIARRIEERLRTYKHVREE